MEWVTEFPTKPGTYWFYGYRYGRNPCGREVEPEMMLVTVRKIANGVVAIADGQMMYESEIEQASFAGAELPEPPPLPSPPQEKPNER